MEAKEDKMALPEGMTCGQCIHLHLCVAMFGVKAGNTTCDFNPSRFSHILKPGNMSGTKEKGLDIKPGDLVDLGKLPEEWLDEPLKINQLERLADALAILGIDGTPACAGWTRRIVVDMAAPLLDGWELNRNLVNGEYQCWRANNRLSQIASNKDLIDLLIIFMGANASREDGERARQFNRCMEVLSHKPGEPAAKPAAKPSRFTVHLDDESAARAAEQEGLELTIFAALVELIDHAEEEGHDPLSAITLGLKFMAAIDTNMAEAAEMVGDELAQLIHGHLTRELMRDEIGNAIRLSMAGKEASLGKVVVEGVTRVRNVVDTAFKAARPSEAEALKRAVLDKANKEMKGGKIVPMNGGPATHHVTPALEPWYVSTMERVTAYTELAASERQLAMYESWIEIHTENGAARAVTAVARFWENRNAALSNGYLDATLQVIYKPLQHGWNAARRSFADNQVLLAIADNCPTAFEGAAWLSGVLATTSARRLGQVGVAIQAFEEAFDMELAVRRDNIVKRINACHEQIG